MPAKRVVYPLFTGELDMRQKNRYIALAASSIASYFQAGNDVPVIVAANDDMSAAVMKFLADQMKYDLTVEIHPAEEVAEFSMQNAQGAGPDNRTSVTGACSSPASRGASSTIRSSPCSFLPSGRTRFP